MPTDLRADAARVIARVLSGTSLNQALPPVLAQTRERDRGLLQQLCYGTLRDGPRLVAILGLMLDRPLRPRDRDITGLLMCGLYQLEGTRIPDHAASYRCHHWPHGQDSAAGPRLSLYRALRRLPELP